MYQQQIRKIKDRGYGSFQFREEQEAKDLQTILKDEVGEDFSSMVLHDKVRDVYHLDYYRVHYPPDPVPDDVDPYQAEKDRYHALPGRLNNKWYFKWLAKQNKSNQDKGHSRYGHGFKGGD